MASGVHGWSLSVLITVAATLFAESASYSDPDDVTIFAEHTSAHLIKSIETYITNTGSDLSPKAASHRARIVARMVAELNHRNKAGSNDSVVFDLVNRASEAFRNISPSDPAYQEAFEFNLMRAIIEREPKVPSACEALERVVANYDTWRFKSDLPPYGDKESGYVSEVRDSYEMPQYAIGALALVSARKALSPPPHGLDDNLRHALAKWMNHPLVNLRSRENEPEIRSRLSQLPNQYMVWGKVYSSLLLDEIEADPEIRALLPSDIIQHDASRTRINPQDLRFIRATSTVMKESLLSNIFKFWDKRNGVSGSHLHTHVLSTSMLALTDEQLGRPSHYFENESIFNNFTRMTEHYLTKGTLALPYVPGGTPISNRSAAARNVPYYFAKLLRGDDSAEARQDLLAALKNFVTHSGSLIVNIPRGKTHKGSDQLAPYYWPPTIPTAIAAGNVLQAFFIPGTKNYEEIQAINRMLRYAVASQIGPDGLFTNVGTETYGKDARAWTTGLPAMALAQACELERGYMTAGIYDTALDGSAKAIMTLYHRPRGHGFIKERDIATEKSGRPNTGEVILKGARAK